MADPWADTSAARIALPMSFEEPYKVVGIERRTRTIIELWLEPVGGALEYLPGEYVLLEDREGRVPPRSFSIANAPRPDGLISLLVTGVPGGETSTWFHERLRVGEEVRISGPYGTFVDDPTSTSPALFLAAGSGLAPIRALLEAALAASGNARPSLTLIFSATAEADVIDRGRFAAWQAQHPQFRFMRTLTRGDGPPPHGRIPALLPTVYRDLEDHDVFVSGAPRFVLACAARADALGAPRARAHTEVFFAEPQPWTGAAPQAENQW